MVFWKSRYEGDSVKQMELFKENERLFSDTFTPEHRILAYVVVTGIVMLTVVFVMLPMLGMPKADDSDNADSTTVFLDSCRISIIESIPDNLTYPSGSPTYPSTFSTWSDLIDNASSSIDIASFYWTLLGRDVISDPSDWQGEETFKKLKSAIKDRSVKLRIVVNKPAASELDNDTKELAEAGADVRGLDFDKLLGSGVLHTKLWIVDKKRIYIGSANMDWRSLTQVKELGVVLNSCPSLAFDASKLFEVYWYLGQSPPVPVPASWPDSFSTKFNKESPMNVKLNSINSRVYFASSPLPFCPTGRTGDIDAILDVIEKAKKFIHIAVMDYQPMIVFDKKGKIFWPVIDDALKRAAIERRVEIKLMTSLWNHTNPDMIKFMKSLQNLNDVSGATIKVKLFRVPAFTKSQAKIPYARVNHNKYMVTDNAAYIGTSNWSGDYFTSTAGVGFIVNQTTFDRWTTTVKTLQQQLEDVFERDWNSRYTLPVLPRPEMKWLLKPTTDTLSI